MADHEPNETGADQRHTESIPIVIDADRAVSTLLSGGLVALPTETVYGLAARAADPDAVERVYAVKDRPRDHPLILHLADITDLDSWAREIPDTAHRLAAAFWPGPLTVLLHRSERVSDIITGGRDTVAVRVPAHDLARRVIQGAGALVAPSANRFGRLSPTTATHVSDDLGAFLDARTDLILDGGPCTIGVESTIVDCTRTPVEVLRPGGVSAEQIAGLLDEGVAAASGPSRASGMLISHYAPQARVVAAADRAEALAVLEQCRAQGRTAETIDLCDDLERYARELYELLHDADRRGVDTVVAVLPDGSGLGAAIADRITKAAADHGPESATDRTSPTR